MIQTGVKAHTSPVTVTKTYFQLSHEHRKKLRSLRPPLEQCSLTQHASKSLCQS